MTDLNTTIDRAAQISRGVADTLDRRLRSAMERYSGRVQRAGSRCLAASATPRTPLDLWQDARQYGIDSVQPSVLFWELNTLLPLPAGAAAVAAEESPARKRAPRTRKRQTRGAARA